MKTIAVIGAGSTACEIAYASALAGFRTVLEDISASATKQGLAWIRQCLHQDVDRGKIEAGARDRALGRISVCHFVDQAIRDADLIIEAGPEELEMKLEIFTIFDKFAKPGAIFASNTSLCIDDFTDIVIARERCIGMRFSSPVPTMRVVEIVRTPHTSDATVATCCAVVHRMHKQAVVVGGAPGFIASCVREQHG